MMLAISKRLANLEIYAAAKFRATGLNKEIEIMTSSERCNLRTFLLFLKNGGKPEDANYESLKLIAEGAIISARKRLKES